MAPKKAPEPAAVEEPVEEEEEVEPEEPEIHKKCFRVGTQTYYGDCKVGVGPRKGTFVRHGYGRQVNAAVSPASYKAGANRRAYETSVMGVYEGNWEDDVMSGQGVYSWSDGSQYDGAFLNGKMHGPGRFMWPDFSTYEGTWHSGQMTGHGRLDYRFDGTSWQGRFQRDAFQKHDGKWVNVWQQTRGLEQKIILDHDTQAAPFVRRVACGEMYARQPQQPVLGEQIARLEEAISTAQNQGYTPFIVADSSLKCCALKCMSMANLSNHSTQSVSVRLAAIAKRRKRDYNGMFYSAIATSLSEGSLFTVVFEDDDEGCGMLSNDDERWFDRQPSTLPPSAQLPEQWRLKEFYHAGTFPCEILQPMLFNGRLMSKLFLPEDLREDSKTLDASNLMPPGASDAPAEAAEEAPAEGEESTAAATPSAEQKCTEAAQAAAAPAPAGGVGLTGHVFELPDVTDPRAVGLRTVHHIRPAIVSLSSVPAGLPDDEVAARVVDRFRAHVPMHRTYLIMLTHDALNDDY